MIDPSAHHEEKAFRRFLISLLKLRLTFDQSFVLISLITILCILLFLRSSEPWPILPILAWILATIILVTVVAASKKKALRRQELIAPRHRRNNSRDINADPAFDEFHQ
jgi:hypothetical protein